MKKLIILFFSLLCMFNTSSSATYGDEMFVYRSGGKVEGYLKSMISKMRVSDIDDNGTSQGRPLYQEIVLPDTIHRIPLDQIDSISFVRPQTIYKDMVQPLHLTLSDYIIGADTTTLLLKNTTPPHLLPEVGTVIATYDLPELLPNGFSGKVESVSTSDNGDISVDCSGVALKNVVRRLYAVFGGATEDDEDGDEAFTRADVTRKYNTFDIGTVGISYPIPVVSPISNPFNILNYLTIKVKPKLRTVTTLIVDDGTYTVHLDGHCDYELKEDIDISSEISFDKTLSFFQKPLLFNIGYGFAVYVDGGLIGGISGETIQSHEFTQKFSHDFTIDLYSDGYWFSDNSHMTNRFELDETKYTLKKVAGNMSAKLGTYFETGLTWLDTEIVRVGARAEVGLKLGAGMYGSFEDYQEETTISDNYNILKEFNGLYLGGYWGASGVGNIFFIDGSIGGEWDTGTPLYGSHYMPDFTSVEAQRIDDTRAAITVKMNEPSKIPFDIGICVKDMDGKIIEKRYHGSQFAEGCGFDSFSTVVSGLSPDCSYNVYPMVKYAMTDILATPTIHCIFLPSESCLW